MLPNRAQTLANAPLEDLLTILLRQFKRPLASHDVTLSDADAQTLAHEVATYAPETPLRASIREALVTLIAESEAVLAGFGLTFEQSLDTPMDKLTGWETTAEFLELANEKSNAELRIAAGAALLTALGDLRHARRLWALHERDDQDPDAQMGRRLLSFAANIDSHAKYWRVLAKVWLDEHNL